MSPPTADASKDNQPVPPAIADTDGKIQMEPEPPYPNPIYAWYVVGVLMILYIINFIDRQVISLIAEPIKRDLQLSDTQIGLLSGLAFAVFYTGLGIPVGRMADRYSRRWIIGIGVFVWSFFAAACGLARSYWELLLARMGVGVGEAALSPAAYSLLPDYFPPQQLGRAYSIYGMGITIGTGIAFIVGGAVVGFASAEGATVTVPLLGEIRAWQFVFIITGLPGIPLALLMLTVKEPFRRGRSRLAKAQVEFAEVIGFLRTNGKTFAPHFFGCSLMSLVGYGSALWLPTMAVRTHGTALPDAGYLLGLITITCATSGLIAAGILADRLTRKGQLDAPVKVCVGVALLNTPLAVGSQLMPSETLFWVTLAASSFIGTSWAGVGAAAVNMATPPAMRAQVSAVYLFVVNIIGLGLGSTIVGLMTDYVFGDPALIRYSLALLAGVFLPLAAILFAIARPGFRALRTQSTA